jgi:menaquinone-dependent protoporphyrinogen oxidase
MEKRILIAYDTVYGSTVEVAEFLGKELGKEGNVVNVHRLNTVNEITDYQAVVLGSPIIKEKVTEDTISFLRRYHDELSQRPLALFIVCLLARGGISTHETAVSNYVNPILKEFKKISPVSISVFAGVLDYDKYPDTVKENMQNLYRKIGGPTEGRHDYRDWNTISSWAKETNIKLQQ